MTTIAEVISRIRNEIKAESQDAFVTDRYVYSLINKFAQLYMRRQDVSNKLMRFNSVWKVLPFIELIEVDKIEAECVGVYSGCTFMRTKDKLPKMIEGYWGPLIRSVTSIDGSTSLQPTYPSTFVSMSKTSTFRYNTTKYFWYLNGYIYVPNVTWNAIKLEGVFDSDISEWLCDEKCIPRYEQQMNIPEAMFAEIEQQVLSTMMNTFRLPSEDSDNKLNPNR